MLRAAFSTEPTVFEQGLQRLDAGGDYGDRVAIEFSRATRISAIAKDILHDSFVMHMRLSERGRQNFERGRQ